MSQTSFLSRRKKLTVYEAARVMAEEFGGKVGEAEALIVEAIEEGDLQANLVRWEMIDDQWEGIPRQGNINPMETTVYRADLDAWMARQQMAPPTPHDEQEEEGETGSGRGGIARRKDALSLELDGLIAEMETNGERVTAVAVMEKLKKRAGQGGCVVESAAPLDGVIWEGSSGKPKTLTLAALEVRLGRKRNRGQR